MKNRKNGQGCVKPLPSGSHRWQITLGFDAEGRQLLKSGTEPNEAEAERALTLALADHHRGLLPIPSQITLADWLPEWLQGKVGSIAPKTEANYRYLIKNKITPVLGHHKLQSLKPSEVKAAYQALANQGFSKSLLHQVRVILKQALQEALMDELVARNVADIARLPSFRRIKTARALDVTEVARYLAVAHRQRLGILFEIVIATGLRRGEVCALRWQHVDLSTGMLYVRENLTIANGKPVLGPPKTEAGIRDLHLAPDTVDLLKKHQERQIAEFGSLNPYVFPNESGNRLYPDSLTTLSRRIAKGADLGRVRFHDLRHTFASLMLSRGVPMEVVSEKLGHSRPSTTADLYRHVYVEEHRQHTFTLAELLRPLPVPFQAKAVPLLDQEDGAA